MYKFLVLALPLLIDSTSIPILLPNSFSEKLALSQKGSIDLSKTFIGGIKIGMSENEAIEKLGSPKSRKTGYNQCTAAYDTTLKYDSLELYLEGGTTKTSKRHVSSITTTNSQYSTNKGIRVGDSISKAEKAYSKAAATGKKGRYLSLVDPNHGECALSFSSNNSKRVNEISLFCAIC